MINLEKGQRISMDKGLTLVGVGLGWDPNEKVQDMISTWTHQHLCLAKAEGYRLMSILFSTTTKNLLTVQLSQLAMT